MILRGDGLVHSNRDTATSFEQNEIHDVLNKTSGEFDDDNCQWERRRALRELDFRKFELVQLEIFGN